jgi:pyruvate/2-oxoacid:ferredoxin oxidoreductase beta subunit
VPGALQDRGEAQGHQHVADRGAPRRGVRAVRPVPAAHVGASRGLDPATTKGSQTREPLFEFSGACAGCGETPYLKLLSQQFGDRAIIANATGCSSIYGGNLPTTPWGTDAAGRGPAWSNSLFEDNAEFGLGMRIALDRQSASPARWSNLARSSPEPGGDVLALDPAARRRRDHRHAARAGGAPGPSSSGLCDDPGPTGRLARRLAPLTGTLVRKNVWIVGGDGWAYDIGSGGLDHVLGSGRDVNILVLDTEVYSNTGGQASKSTPRARSPSSPPAARSSAKKDLGAEARRYGNVYIAQVAVGANDVQTVKAFAQAEAWPGVSLIIAYSTCIAHGIDMRTSMSHQKVAVRSGYWPLYRYQPDIAEDAHPFQLDSNDPTVPLVEFVSEEAASPCSPGRSRAGRRAARAGPGRHRRTLALLPPAGRRAASRCRTPKGRITRERRPSHHLSGLELASPIVASAGPLTGKLSTLRRLEAAACRRRGVAVVVRRGGAGRRVRTTTGCSARAPRCSARLRATCPSCPCRTRSTPTSTWCGRHRPPGHPRDRQPQRRQLGAAGCVRRRNGAGRGVGARAERLPGGRRPR